ncbi:VWA domain-containing protein [Bacillus sp. REN3]|uniref:VWA domain-containing protein n=1 Tax=Bacillus sp. REN3 TaxID=2802440 RepID=UPI001AED55D7|nr:VWA domain-containing protein [Bacillus sp. REN3]
MPRGKISVEDLETESTIKLNWREVKGTINVAMILDASGSMKKVQNGKTLMEAAKESIRDFTSSLPENANVSLTVYGHKGSGSEKDKELSCNGIEEVYSLSKYDAAFDSALNSIPASGWTSIAQSMKTVGSKLMDQTDATNVIYLVSGGKETCDGDAAEEARVLAESKVNPIRGFIPVRSESVNHMKNHGLRGSTRYLPIDQLSIRTL